MARKRTFGTKTQLTTSVADLGGVVRFNFNNFDTSTHSFIFNKALQLIERPIANPIVHSFASMDISNSFEVFHHNLVSVEIGNNIFTDVVVYPSHPTSFSSREFFKQSLAGTSAFTLKLGTQILEFSFDLLDFSRIIKSTVRSDSKVIYSKVNAKNSSLRATVQLRGINLFRECEYKETSASLIHTKQTFSNLPIEIFFIAFGDIEFELLPTIKQSQNQSISFKVSTSRKVISNRSSFDSWLSFSLLDHSASLSHTGDSDLCWKSEPLSDGMVDSIMELEVMDNLMFPSVINTELQSFCISGDSLNYFISWVDSYFSTDSCTHISEEYADIYKSFGGWQFLPRLKTWVSLPYVL